MDSFVYFSFLQGVVMFFAPCAVALLPAYIVSFVSKDEERGQSNVQLALSGLKLAGLSIAGIFVIYLVAGSLIVLASQFIKTYMKWIAMGMGAAVIVLGVLQLLGRDFTLNLHFRRKQRASESAEAFFFGVAYAIGALGCLFPLFLVVMTQALAAPSMTTAASYVLAYFLGLSLLMVVTIVLAIFSQDFLNKHLRKILPRMHKISGVLLILAGIYIINYQLILV